MADALCDNSGRERTGAFCYAVGWTQHTVGVQYIRTAAIVQMLLGNMGRPGGGILALRGHASIQGSTDIPTLYNILPGYIPMPHAEHDDGGLDGFVEANSPDGGFWGDMKSYTVSLLKAWFGDAATADNDFCFDHLPRITGDHSTYQSVLDMLDGKLDGFLVLGENPAVGSANGRLHRLAMANLDWLVVRDFQEIETASFWHDAPEIETGELRTEDIGTEVFLLPAATHVEKDGTFTNTQRLLQWHDKAVEPPGDGPVRPLVRLPPGPHHPREARRLRRPPRPPDPRPHLGLPAGRPARRSRRRGRAARRSTGGTPTATRSSSYTDLADDGSTACGCWIYCGCYADGRQPAPPAHVPGAEQSWVAPEWGWAWPANRRILYNRASADPDGSPWSERKRYVWWDDGRADAGRATTSPTSAPTRRPDYEPSRGRRGDDALSGRSPVRHAGRRQGVAVRAQRARRRPAAHPLRAPRVAVRRTRSTASRPTRSASASTGRPTRTTRPPGARAPTGTRS